MSLEEMTPKVEQHSIDDMFLDLTGIDECEDFEYFCRRLRMNVINTTGLVIGVGMGPTKTLAKSAQWASKQWPQFRDVLALTTDKLKRTATLLENQPVEEIWGGFASANVLICWVFIMHCGWRAPILPLSGKTLT